MNKQRGFTLLEIILALVIFASCAMMVVSTIPSRSGADIFGQQLKALVDYGSDRAVMDGNILGLVITADKYQLVTLTEKNGERRWMPLSAGRITTLGDFPEDMHVSLSPQRLAATTESEPQIVFLPDGEIGRFTLTLQSYDKQHFFRVVSQGAAPVSVENDG
ncbi:type II secretion system minor pseudopilin GspH [Enterobacter sp. RHBSTW-00994]|uniref:type II secretion system minor pseudopilin GspH n=1 Tax=Enterobacter sp. RHBSTW-00994 TaxID=2742676 RepID=UPI0015E91FF5|nr:type II secretion system minor pseudopilin GspH [Enterobacter sp. RHBSTW-00994]QLR42477.1 type II secretion system minor pseudopilin GspH [Enterobacter sp. RHBSTW-00994]